MKLKNIVILNSIVLLLFSSNIFAVSEIDEEIVSARNEAIEAQIKLDSLVSLSNAQTIIAALDSTDSVFVNDNNIQILVASKSKITNLRDPQYVDITIPYLDWDSLTRRIWLAELRLSGIGTINISTGRYSIHISEINVFLDFIKNFIENNVFVEDEITNEVEQ